jgi:hypothetical protein
LTHPQDIDAPLHIAAQRKINSYRQQSEHLFSSRHCQHIHPHARRILRLLFLQARRETEAHFTATGMPSQRNQSDSFRFKRAAIFQSLTGKVGLAATKAAALRINLNVQGCGIVAVRRTLCGADAGAADNEVQTPVWIAAADGHTETVRALVQECGGDARLPTGIAALLSSPSESEGSRLSSARTPRGGGGVAQVRSCS